MKDINAYNIYLKVVTPFLEESFGNRCTLHCPACSNITYFDFEDLTFNYRYNEDKSTIYASLYTNCPVCRQIISINNDKIHLK